MSDKEKTTYTVAELAERYDRDQRTIRRWITEGRFPGAKKEIPAFRTSPYVIPESAVDHFEKAHGVSS